MGNSNCSKCCKGELARDEIDPYKEVGHKYLAYQQENYKPKYDKEYSTMLPNTVLRPIAPESKYAKVQLKAVYRLQALCRGHFERKQYNFLRSMNGNKILYFSKNDLHLTLSHKLISLPISEDLEVRNYTYPSGAIYSGQWLGGFRHGIGTMKWTDSSSFSGNWQFGYPSGKGKFLYFDGDFFEGMWINPYPIQNCKIQDGFSWLATKQEFYSNFEEIHKKMMTEIINKHNSNLKSLIEPKKKIVAKMAEVKKMNFIEIQPGSKYQGEVFEGKRHGFGRNIWEIGDLYEGQWEDNCQSGWGQNIWVDGSEFFGLYKSGVKNGLGDYIWEDKTQYTGDWANNKMHGIGKYIFADKREYLGEWSEGLMHGFGIFVWPDGRRYEGFWKNNKKDGIGISFSPNGSSHTDLWAKGKKLKKKV